MNSLKNCLFKMLSEFEDSLTKTALNDKRYSVKELMEKPHIQVLRSIFELYELAENLLRRAKVLVL